MEIEDKPDKNADESSAVDRTEEHEEPEETTIREEIGFESDDKIEYHLFDKFGQKVKTTIIIDKKNKNITLFPFTISPVKGITTPRIQEIHLKGWQSIESLPGFLKSGKRFSLGGKPVAPIFRYLKSEFPKFKKLTIHKSEGRTWFSRSAIEFKYSDLRSIYLELSKEIKIFKEREKTAVQNSLANLSSKFKIKFSTLNKGAVERFFSHYDDYDLNAGDADTLFGILTDLPFANTKITTNIIETKNRVSAAYLDGVIDEYKTLMSATNDNEKDWQSFFEEHGWILSSVFPYQVVLKGREAYLGGKTLENDGSRLIDFLFENGFKDNYALLEIKTHNTPLLKNKAYREPHAYAVHDKCAGAIAQCLDQKQTFVTDMGRKSSFDPSVALVIGQKSKLSKEQIPSFELARNNQKSIDIVTFDELYEKVVALRNLLLGTAEE